MTARGFLGAGDLFIARQVAGVYGPYLGPFEASKFEIKPNVDVKEQTSKGRDTYGQVIETVALAKAADLTVELSEVNKESLTIALLGTASAISGSAGSVVAEVSIGKMNAWQALAHEQVSAVVVKDTSATTTYVNGVDYIVNPRLGWYKVLPGGSIVDADSLKISYTYSAITGTKIAGGTNAQIRAKFKLDGKNFADDQPCIVTVHEGVIASSSAFDFLSGDFAKVTMPGKMKTPVGYTEPFTVELRDA